MCLVLGCYAEGIGVTFLFAFSSSEKHELSRAFYCYYVFWLPCFFYIVKFKLLCYASIPKARAGPKPLVRLMTGKFTHNYLLTATYYTKLPSFSRLTLTRNEHHPKPRPRYVTFPSVVLRSFLCVSVLMCGALNVTIIIFRLAPAGKGLIILSKNNLSVLFKDLQIVQM